MSGLTEEWFAELRRATSAVISASSSGSYEEFYRARDNFRAAMNWNAAHVLLNEIERLQREAKCYSKAAEWRSKAQDAEREIERLRQELDETERERVRFTDLYVEARSEIGDLRRERETLANLLRQVDVVMNGAAMDGVKSILAPQYQDEWALVHTTVREQIALLDGEKGDGTS